jgi:glycosyltransferase involved in cell wall biosynthesis
MASDAPRVLHVGPDVRGGMRTATHELLGSPLAQNYRLEFVVTHRGPGMLRRLSVYLAALARIALWSLGGRGRIVHVHGTVRGSMFRKAICVLLAKALLRRVVFHIHSGPGDVASFSVRLSRVGSALIRFAFGRADVVLAVSAGSAASLEDAFGVDGILVVPNIVPAAPSGPERRSRCDDPVAVYLGGFANPVKGGAILLDALRRPQVAGLRVVLSGPGDLPPEGRSLVDGPAPIEWRGWLEASEKDSLLRSATVFVLPSTSEGLPMALLEAMAYGLAIVATEVGGVPEVVSNGVEAVIVPPGAPEALAVALAHLRTDTTECERLGRSAQERVKAFSPAAVAAQLREIYRELA